MNWFMVCDLVRAPEHAVLKRVLADFIFDWCSKAMTCWGSLFSARHWVLLANELALPCCSLIKMALCQNENDSYGWVVITDNTCHYKLTKTTKTELKVRLRWWPGNIEEKPRQRWADAPSSESGDKVPTASWDEEVEEWEVACQPAGKRRWRNEKLPAKLLFSPATQR